MSVVVAAGRRLERLPPSPAPLLLGVGFVLLVVGAFLGAVPVAGAVVSTLGLLVLLAGAVAAWLRLTDGGRVLMAVPVVVWVLAFVAVRVGGPGAGQVLTYIAVLLSLLAFVVVFQPLGSFSGIQRGRVNRGFVRRYAVQGFAECRIDGEGVRILAGPGESQSYAMKELGPPRVELRETHSDLSIVDCYGDVVLLLRGTTPEERRAIAAVLEELRGRLGV